MAAGILFFGGSFLFVNWRISRLEEIIIAKDTVLRSQLDTDAQTLDLLKQRVLLLGQDTNLFRKYFQLPLHPLPSFGDEEAGEPPPETNELYFKAVKILLTQRDKEEAMAALSEFLNSPEVTDLLSRHDLTVHNHHEVDAEFWKEGETLHHRLSATVGKNSFTVLSPGADGGQVATVSDLDSYLEENAAKVDSFYQRLKRMEEELAAMEKEVTLKNLLPAKGLNLSKPTQAGEKILRQITDASGRTFLVMGLEKNKALWILGEKTYQDKGEFLSAAIAAIEGLDLRSPEEVMIQEAKDILETLRRDDGFLAYLKSEGLSLTRQPREDLYYFYYDLLDAGRKTSGSFAVQKNSGELYLMDKNDVLVTSLKTLGIQQDFTEKKNAPSLLK